MVDWSTFGCGREGHVTFAPDEAELRAEMSAAGPDGLVWQCLRCGNFVPGEPNLSGPAANAPVVPRGKEVRSKFILRLFAIERWLRGLIFGAAAVGLWQYRHSRGSVEAAFDRKLPIVRDLLRELGYNIDKSKLFGLLQHALTLSSRTLTLLAIGVGLYAVIEVVEGTGLWLARRWGEYFAMIATSLGLPLEIYDLTRKVTATALVLLAINLLLVLYLVLTKRLFGIRGGKKAYDAKLRSESVLEAAERTAAGRKAVAAFAGGPMDRVPAASGRHAMGSRGTVSSATTLAPDPAATEHSATATEHSATDIETSGPPPADGQATARAMPGREGDASMGQQARFEAVKGGDTGGSSANGEPGPLTGPTADAATDAAATGSPGTDSSASDSPSGS